MAGSARMFEGRKSCAVFRVFGYRLPAGKIGNQWRNYIFYNSWGSTRAYVWSSLVGLDV